VILLDTSGLLAALFPDQRTHRACAEVLREHRAPFVLSPFVLAEVDYLVTKLAGVPAEIALLQDVAGGAYQLAPFHAEDVEEARKVVAQHADLAVGLADASLVVLARRLRCRDLLTLDERHFRTLQPSPRRTFRLLPTDR